MDNEVIIGIDLAGKKENPTGMAIWKSKTLRVNLLYQDSQILKTITQTKPEIIAIDAPFSFPKSGILRKADREMIKKGYRVFPPSLPAMRKLTVRAIKLKGLITKRRFKTIEVHPTSTCKALNMPSKEWRKIQTVLTQLGLKGDLQMRTLTPHETDAAVAALTGYLYLKNQTESLGHVNEGYIIIPKKQNWRTLSI